MQENQDLIGYDEIIESSMRSVIYETLKKIEVKGLPGSHYFVISFLTNYPDVSLSEHLKEKYQDEMTIVMQHQYKNLTVEQDHFEVSLSFAGKYEKLMIPYKAVTSFADPSMNFGLKFSVSYEGSESPESPEESAISLVEDEGHANKNSDKSSKKKPSKKTKATSKTKAKTKKKKAKIDTSEKVVSLDEFRKEKNDDNKK